MDSIVRVIRLQNHDLLVQLKQSNYAAYRCCQLVYPLIYIDDESRAAGKVKGVKTNKAFCLYTRVVVIQRIIFQLFSRNKLTLFFHLSVTYLFNDYCNEKKVNVTWSSVDE